MHGRPMSNKIVIVTMKFRVLTSKTTLFTALLALKSASCSNENFVDIHYGVDVVGRVLSLLRCDAQCKLNLFRSKSPRSCFPSSPFKSFPMHHANVSTNFAWLPHNLDPSLPTPEEFKAMPVSPFANKQEFHDNMIQGCIERYGGRKCQLNEKERIQMSLRQPKVRVEDCLLFVAPRPLSLM